MPTDRRHQSDIRDVIDAYQKVRQLLRAELARKRLATHKVARFVLEEWDAHR